MTDKDKMVVATLAMQGMLAHQKRYKPRDQDSHLHWHDALSKEAFDIADAMANEAVSRDLELD